MTLRHLLLLLGLSMLLVASDCFPIGDDDDDEADDDDDDDISVGDTTITGEVIAVDRDTGLELAPSVFAERAGGLIVYALPDAADLSEILGKETMEGPGEFEITITDYVGPFDVVVVADEDSNNFIENSDVLRHYAFNPLAAAGNPIDDVTLVIDLAPRGGGGGCGDRETISGTVVLDGLPDGPIGVSTNNAALTHGPWSRTLLDGAGPYSIDECVSRSETGLLGYLDADGNGYYEPSDPIGGAAANPIQLGLGDVSGITITIPDGSSAPVPPAYVGITGTVAYDAFSTGDILVNASHVTTDGYLYSTVTLAAPGAFALLAPAHTEGVLVWAVLDEDGDGEADPAVDPSDSSGPHDSGSGLSGIDLELGPAAPGSISGTVTYTGPAAPGESLHMGVFATETYDPASGPPVGFLEILNPGYPQAYSFPDLPSGTYWVGGYHDIGSDDPFSAGPGDPEAQVGPVLLSPGGSLTVDITLPSTP